MYIKHITEYSIAYRALEGGKFDGDSPCVSNILNSEGYTGICMDEETSAATNSGHTESNSRGTASLKLFSTYNPSDESNPAHRNLLVELQSNQLRWCVNTSTVATLCSAQISVYCVHKSG